MHGARFRRKEPGPAGSTPASGTKFYDDTDKNHRQRLSYSPDSNLYQGTRRVLARERNNVVSGMPDVAEDVLAVGGFPMNKRRRYNKAKARRAWLKKFHNGPVAMTLSMTIVDGVPSFTWTRVSPKP